MGGGWSARVALVLAFVASSCSSDGRDVGTESSLSMTPEENATVSSLDAPTATETDPLETAVADDPSLEIDNSALSPLFVGADVSPAGWPLGLAGEFAETTETIIAFVRVREPTTIEFAWSQVGEDGDEVELFTHDVTAEAGDVAFSKALSPGTLEASAYMVRARSASDEEAASFVVRPTGSGASPSGASGPPQPGASGAQSTEPAGVTPYIYVETPAVTAPHVVAFVDGSVGPSVDITVTGARGRVSRRVRLVEGGVQLDLDPCRVGSDLPGSTLTWTASVVGGGSLELIDDAASTVPFPTQHTTMLGRDDRAPTIFQFDTSPASGAPVDRGDTISFDVIARDQKGDGPSWQTGVQRLQVLGMDELAAVADGPTRPPSCDDSQRVVAVRDEYVVPDDAPSTVRLCAVAEDYAGNVATKCHEFRVGEERWEGSLSLSFDGNITSGAGDPCRGTAEFTVQFNVRGDEVTGAGTISGPPYVCTVDGVDFPGIEPTGPVGVTGSRTAAGFELVLTPGPGSGCCPAWPGAAFGVAEVPIVSPGRAELSLAGDTSMGQPWAGTLQLDAELTCSTCAGVS